MASLENAPANGHQRWYTIVTRLASPPAYNHLGRCPQVDVEAKIIEALMGYVSRGAAEGLLRRVLHKARKNPLAMGPQEWVELIEGPLLAELQQVLPINGQIPPLRGLVKGLRQIRGSVPSPVVQAEAPLPLEPTLEQPLDWIDLSQADVRLSLLQELARVEGVLGVAIQTPWGEEIRLPEDCGGLPLLVSTAHRLLSLRRPYAMFYTVMGNAQLMVRGMGQSWVAVLADHDANPGHLLYRLRQLQTAPQEARPR